jgi:hypothetical protein
MEARIIKGFSVKLRTENILKHAGFPLWVQEHKPQRVKRQRKIIKEVKKGVKLLMYPRAIYQAFDYEILSRKRVLLFNKESGRQGILTSSYLVKRNILKFKPEKLVLFVATFGDEIMEGEKKGYSAFHLDVIGSEGAEAVARYICKLMAQECGFKKSFRRLSPGYGEATGFDWKIPQQKVIFDLLGRGKIKEELGVELLNSSEHPSCLMVPQKTVSGIAFPTEPRP